MKFINISICIYVYSLVYIYLLSIYFEIMVGGGAVVNSIDWSMWVFGLVIYMYVI